MFPSPRRTTQRHSDPTIHPALSTATMDAMDGIPPSYLRQRATAPPTGSSLWNDSRESFFSRCFSTISRNSSAGTVYEGPGSPSPSQWLASLRGMQSSRCLEQRPGRPAPTLATLQADLRGAWPFGNVSGMEGMEVAYGVPRSGFADAEEEEVEVVEVVGAYEYGVEGMVMEIDGLDRWPDRLEREPEEEDDPPPPYTPFGGVEERAQGLVQDRCGFGTMGNPVVFRAPECCHTWAHQFSSAPLGGMSEEERRALTGSRAKAPKMGKKFNLDRVSSRVGKGLNSVKNRVKKLPQTTQRLQDGLRVMRAKGKMESW